jgi:hypothetical protein
MMTAESKTLLIIFAAEIIVYFLTITLSTQTLVGIALGTVLYIGIMLEAKVNHIMKQKDWY